MPREPIVTVKADVGGLETVANAPGLRSGSCQPFIQIVQSEQNGYMEELFVHRV